MSDNGLLELLESIVQNFSLKRWQRCCGSVKGRWSLTHRTYAGHADENEERERKEASHEDERRINKANGRVCGPKLQLPWPSLASAQDVSQLKRTHFEFNSDVSVFDVAAQHEYLASKNMDKNWATHLRKNVLSCLTKLSHGSTPFITTFILIHLTAPAMATIGGSGLSSQTMVCCSYLFCIFCFKSF